MYFNFYNQSLAVQESIAKSILKNYVASSCKNFMNEKEVELIDFHPKIFGFEGETPYLNLLLTFLSAETCYAEEHDEQENPYMFALINGEVFKNKNGEGLTLIDFAYNLEYAYQQNDNESLKSLMSEALLNVEKALEQLLKDGLLNEIKLG